MNIQLNDNGPTTVTGLPDGSKIITQKDRVIALNTVAGQIWDIIQTPTTFDQLVGKIQEKPEVIESALVQLSDEGLASVSTGITRRSMVAMTIPFVVSMTLAQQKVYARSAQSVNTITHYPRPFPVRNRNTNDNWNFNSNSNTNDNDNNNNNDNDN